MTSNKLKNDFLLRSFFDGKVYEIRKKVGELVIQQEPIAYVGDKNIFIIELQIDEVDIARIKIGQRLIVSFDALGKKPFEATVSKIYPKMDLKMQTFKIEANFINQPDNLYPGFTGEGNVLIQKIDNALTIPTEYLINGNKVLTENGEKSVKIGLKTLNKVQILSGIDAKTRLTKPD